MWENHVLPLSHRYLISVSVFLVYKLVNDLIFVKVKQSKKYFTITDYGVLRLSNQGKGDSFWATGDVNLDLSMKINKDPIWKIQNFTIILAYKCGWGVHVRVGRGSLFEMGGSSDNSGNRGVQQKAETSVGLEMTWKFTVILNPYLII